MGSFCRSYQTDSVRAAGLFDSKEKSYSKYT